MQVRPAAAQSLRTRLCFETRSNGDLVMRELSGVQILIYRADIHRIKETCGVRKPSPAGKVAGECLTDEEDTNPQITRLFGICKRIGICKKNALLIHRKRSPFPAGEGTDKHPFVNANTFKNVLYCFFMKSQNLFVRRFATVFSYGCEYNSS